MLALCESFLPYGPICSRIDPRGTRQGNIPGLGPPRLAIGSIRTNRGIGQMPTGLFQVTGRQMFRRPKPEFSARLPTRKPPAAAARQIPFPLARPAGIIALPSLLPPPRRQAGVAAGRRLPAAARLPGVWTPVTGRETGTEAFPAGRRGRLHNGTASCQTPTTRRARSLPRKARQRLRPKPRRKHSQRTNHKSLRQKQIRKTMAGRTRRAPRGSSPATASCGTSAHSATTWTPRPR